MGTTTFIDTSADQSGLSLQSAGKYAVTAIHYQCSNRYFPGGCTRENHPGVPIELEV
jgi:hypothetical protein